MERILLGGSRITLWRFGIVRPLAVAGIILLLVATSLGPAVLAAPNAPGFSIEVTSQEIMWVDANKCGATGPRGAWLSFWITNISGKALDDVTVTFSGFTGTVPAGNIYFKGTTDPVRELQSMQVNEVEAIYFYVDYSGVCSATSLIGNRATYSVNVTTSTDGGSWNTGTGLRTVESDELLTASAAGLVTNNVLGPGVFIGQLLTQDVTYSFNNNTDLFFQPAAEALFQDGCLRLADMQVRSTTCVTGIPLVSDNRLYFPNGNVNPSCGAGIVDVTYYWEVRCANATQTASPWAAGKSGQPYKYQAIGAPVTINPPSPSLTVSKTAPVCKDKDTGPVQYTVTFTNVTGAANVPAFLKSISDVLPSCMSIASPAVVPPSQVTTGPTGNSFKWPNTLDTGTVSWVSKYQGFGGPYKNIQGWQINAAAPNNTLSLVFTADLTNCPTDQGTVKYTNIAKGTLGDGSSPLGTITASNDFYYPCSPAAVTLASFAADAQADHVLVSWETVSEAGNAGFNLYRAISPDGARTRINPKLIPSQVPGSAQGASYDWTDSYDLVSGTTYHYWLEHVSMTGATTLGEPVSITFGAPAAVRLREFGAAGIWPPLAWLGGLGLAALAAGALVRRRQQS